MAEERKNTGCTEGLVIHVHKERMTIVTAGRKITEGIVRGQNEGNSSTRQTRDTTAKT